MKITLIGQMVDLPTVLAKQGHRIQWYNTAPRNHKVRLPAEVEIIDTPLDVLRKEKQQNIVESDLILLNLSAHQMTKALLTQFNDFYPTVPILYNKDKWRSGKASRFDLPVRAISLREMITGAIQRERYWVKRKRRVAELRALMEDAKRVLILTHNNPDPDSLASALALRVLLGRNNRTATIGYMGHEIHRPENVQMVELLDIGAKRITFDDIAKYDRIALVDCQPPYFAPPYFEEALPRVDAVFDHHPELPGYSVPFKEVRVSEGATSTILTTLVRAADIEISERLATALLYAIKTDTFFMRDAAIDDIDSFTHLYQLANVNIIRRMEKPEIDSDQLLKFGEAIRNHVLFDKVFMCFAGEDVKEDMIARLADFGLQTRGIEWSCAFGFEGDLLVMSMRNVGYVKGAGRVLRNVFGTIGSAGGHRNAARALITREALAEKYGTENMGRIDEIIMRTLLDEIEGEPAEA